MLAFPFRVELSDEKKCFYFSSTKNISYYYEEPYAITGYIENKLKIVFFKQKPYLKNDSLIISKHISYHTDEQEIMIFLVYDKII